MPEEKLYHFLRARGVDPLEKRAARSSDCNIALNDAEKGEESRNDSFATNVLIQAVISGGEV